MAGWRSGWAWDTQESSKDDEHNILTGWNPRGVVHIFVSSPDTAKVLQQAKPFAFFVAVAALGGGLFVII